MREQVGDKFVQDNRDVCAEVLTNIGLASTIQALGSIFVTAINIAISTLIHKIVRYERHYLKSPRNGQIVLVSLVCAIYEFCISYHFDSNNDFLVSASGNTISFQ